jgi:hypothetical protein
VPNALLNRILIRRPQVERRTIIRKDSSPAPVAGSRNAKLLSGNATIAPDGNGPCDEPSSSSPISFYAGRMRLRKNHGKDQNRYRDRIPFRGSFRSPLRIRIHRPMTRRVLFALCGRIVQSDIVRNSESSDRQEIGQCRRGVELDVDHRACRPGVSVDQ